MVFQKALGMNLGPGIYMLDAYNCIVIVRGISCTVTTRINTANHTYLLEVDE